MKSFSITLNTLFAGLILSIILSTALITCIPSTSLAIQPPPASNELNTLTNQAESAFLNPMGLDLNIALNQYPDLLAMTMGLALHRQMQYMNNEPNLLTYYSPLRREAMEFLHKVAKLHNYRHPNDGTPLGNDRMDEELMNGVAGEPNRYFINEFGINPSTVDLPLLLGQPQNDIQIHGAFAQQDDVNEEAITLFGESIKGTEGNISTETGDFPENLIVGTWEGHYGENVIQFIKTPQGYQADFIHVLPKSYGNRPKVLWQIVLDAKSNIEWIPGVYNQKTRLYRGMVYRVNEKGKQQGPADVRIYWIDDKQVYQLSVSVGFANNLTAFYR